MASLFNRISRFARSPQGKRMIGQARRAASDPQNRRRLTELRRRFAGRR